MHSRLFPAAKNAANFHAFSRLLNSMCVDIQVILLIKSEIQDKKLKSNCFEDVQKIISTKDNNTRLYYMAIATLMPAVQLIAKEFDEPPVGMHSS